MKQEGRFFDRSSVVILLGSLLATEACQPPLGPPEPDGARLTETAFAALGAEGEVDGAAMPVEMTRSGHGSLWSGVRVGSSRVRVGGTGILSTQYRAVFSFDTSSIPDDATVLGAFLGIAVVDEGLPSDFVEYFADHLVAEIASPSGFSGSPALSSSDLHAPAAGSMSFTYNPAIGFPIVPDDLLDLVNTRGPTQVRLSFRANPERYLVEFHLAAGPAPFMTVLWEDPDGATCASVLCPDGTTCELRAPCDGCPAEPTCLEATCDCEPVDAPVCGEDGATYGSACEANCAGAAVASEGPCDAPAWERHEADFGSPSPYRNASWMMESFVGPSGTSEVRLSFSRFALAEDGDAVTLYDSRWQPVEVYTGAIGPFVSGSIVGSTVHLVFASGLWGTGDGFHVDAVEFLVAPD